MGTIIFATQKLLYGLKEAEAWETQAEGSRKYLLRGMRARRVPSPGAISKNPIVEPDTYFELLKVGHARIKGMSGLLLGVVAAPLLQSPFLV